jgi:riboflavin kinase/FMN adenylyltransferase
VYVTRVRIGEGADSPGFNAVTNAGMRPTFDGAGYAIESHLLDGPPPIDLTDATPIEVCFLMRLRDERRFPSPEALKQQILRDVARAQKYFRRAGLASRELNPGR